MIHRDGIILIDKNPGFTSSDTVRMVGRKLKSRKAGHTGTLDKFASGLLVCVAGSFTRLAGYLTEQDKEYEAVVEFGRETDTLDPEGQETATSEVPDISVIEKALEGFRGTILQTPPVYSALHIDGKRAYKRALNGESVEMPERQITVDALEILSWDEPFLTLRVSCSKGTYIRSLARDIALTAGSRAYLTGLRRTRVGISRIEDAVSPMELNVESPLIQHKDDIEKILGLSGVTVGDDQVEDFLSGRGVAMEKLEASATLNDSMVCFDSAGRFLGVLVKKEQGFGYGMVNGSLRD